MTIIPELAYIVPGIADCPFHESYRCLAEKVIRGGSAVPLALTHAIPVEHVRPAV
jgi:hypothetical protein